MITQKLTRKEMLEELINVEENNVLKLQINVQYIQRKALFDKKLEAGLAAMQTQVKQHEEMLEFLKEQLDEE